MKINRLYYTVEQLAAHWCVSVDDVMQLGFTNQLAFLAVADYYYPDAQITQIAQHTTITSDDLAHIYYAKEPIETSGFIEFSDLPNVLRGDRVTITHHNGIDRLIINASEVERFENEQNQTNSDAPPLEMNDDAQAAFFKFWNNADQIETDTHPTNETVANWLIENRNVSPTKAARIATDIRPKWGAKGRPKKK